LIPINRQKWFKRKSNSPIKLNHLKESANPATFKRIEMESELEKVRIVALTEAISITDGKQGPQRTQKQPQGGEETLSSMKA